jgi:hypothetical protein
MATPGDRSRPPLQWFRYYITALHNPKVQRLSGEQFKDWVNLLCVAAGNDWVLPPLPEIAFALRKTEEETTKTLDAMISADLLDRSERGLEPHNWRERQFASDSAGAKRQERYRRRKHQGAQGTQARPEPSPESFFEWHMFYMWFTMAFDGMNRPPDHVFESLDWRCHGFMDYFVETYIPEAERCGDEPALESLFCQLLFWASDHAFTKPVPRTEFKVAFRDPREASVDALLIQAAKGRGDLYPTFEDFRQEVLA